MRQSVFIAAVYLRRRLASGEGIVSLGIRLSRCVCVHCISLGSEGNALYVVLSSSLCTYLYVREMTIA